MENISFRRWQHAQEVNWCISNCLSLHNIIEDAYGGSSPHPQTKCTYTLIYQTVEFLLLSLQICLRKWVSCKVFSSNCQSKVGPKQAMLARQVEFKEEITSQSRFFLELFLSAQKQLQHQKKSLCFRSLFGVKKRSEFFHELYLLLPLHLRLKNAPKETCGPTNVLQRFQKWCQNLAKIWPWVEFFWFSVHRVFERPYNVFTTFHWLALLQSAGKTHSKAGLKNHMFLTTTF